MQIEGICQGCGQIVSVEAETQEEADNKATRNCNCDRAKQVQSYDRLMEQIDEFCADGCEELGFSPLPDKTIFSIKTTATQILENNIDKSTFQVEGTTISIVRREKNVIVSRKKTLKVEGASHI